MKRLLDRKLLRRIVLAGTLVLTPTVFAADRGRVVELGDQLMCMCGCGQLLGRCNHVDCKKSVPMLQELATQIDAGETNRKILAAFVDKYGESVLADGGGMKAVPYLVLVGGALVAVTVVRKWKRSNTASGPAPEAEATPAPAPAESEYRRRAEEDLKKLTPED